MPKKLIVAGICLLIFGGTLSAQERYTVDKVVAVVGNSAILYSELQEASQTLVEDRRRQGYTSDRDPMNEALEGLLLQKLLFNQAQVDSVQINLDGVSQQVEDRLAAMTQEAGSITALEAKMGKPYYDIRQDLKSKIEEMYYAESMRNEITSKVKITPGEVEYFYKGLDKNNLPLVPEQYIYAQITRFPVSDKEAKQEARQRLLEMRERIIAGTRFDLLARMYSVDQGTAMNGGEMEPLPLDYLVQPFADALAKLEPNQISEVVETEFGYHIIQLLEKKGDLYRCRHILLRPVYSPQELAEGGLFLDSLARKIRAGEISFADAALKHSDDKYSRQNGGVVTNHEILELQRGDIRYSSTKFMREQLPDDYPVLRNLAEGEISTSFTAKDLRGNDMNKVIKLVKVIPAHSASLNEDYTEIEELALQTKMNKELEKWIDKKIDGMYVRIEPEFRDGAFANGSWVK